MTRERAKEGIVGDNSKDSDARNRYIYGARSGKYVAIKLLHDFNVNYKCLVGHEWDGKPGEAILSAGSLLEITRWCGHGLYVRLPKGFFPQLKGKERKIYFHYEDDFGKKVKIVELED